MLKAGLASLILLFGAALASSPALGFIVGEDDRDEITRTAGSLGLSKAEIDQAYFCTGTIVCPYGRGSAGLVCASNSMKGSCTADRLVTSRHLFTEPLRPFLRKEIDKCKFHNYRGFSTHLKMQDLALAEPIPYLHYIDERADRAVIRLSKPVPGCRPYNVEGVKSGDDLIALTHVQQDIKAKFSGKHPLAYRCKALRLFSTFNGGPDMLYGDCDTEPGASGALLLSRGGDGRLNAVATIVGSIGPAGQQSIIEKASRAVVINNDYREQLSTLKPPPVEPAIDRNDIQHVVDHDGARYIAANASANKPYNLPDWLAGALVSEVAPHSPAERMDVRVGDVIVAITLPHTDPNWLSDTKAIVGPAGLKRALMRAEKLDRKFVTAIRVRDGQHSHTAFFLSTLPWSLDERSLVERLVRWTTMDGLDLAVLDEDGRRHFNLSPSVKGVLVKSVLQGSPAALLDWRPGDVMVMIRAGENTRRIPLFYPGQVKMVFEDALSSGISSVTAIVQRGDGSGPTALFEREMRLFGEAKLVQPEAVSFAGAVLKTLNGDLRILYDLPDDVRGAVVVSIRPGAAADAGIQESDVILEVDGRTVLTANEVSEFTHEGQLKGSKDTILYMRSANGATQSRTVKFN